MASKKIVGIYRITCTVNGLHYVGQSKNIETRWKAHRNQLDKLCHKNIALQDDWFLYGKDAFEWVILESCKPADLDEREIKWANYYDALQSGYCLQLPSREKPMKVDGWRQREHIILRFRFNQLRPVGSWINTRLHDGYVPYYIWSGGDYCLSHGPGLPYWFTARQDSIGQFWTCAWQETGLRTYLAGSYRDLPTDLWAVLR